MGVLAKKLEQEASMIEKFISPGDKLEMKSIQEVTLPDETVGIKMYKSTVFDISEDGKIMIVMPMEKTKMVLLPTEGEYEVCFFTHGGMYNANIRIIDRQKINNTYVLVTEMLTNLHKYQRREYYRFNCIIEMVTKELDKAEAEAFGKHLGYLISETDMKRGVIVDISGGGLRFVSRQPFQEGNILYLRFRLPFNDKEKEFKLAARVILSREIEKRQNEYENRVKFLYIDNITREEIIKYIFNEERKNRKNGKR
ncbi:MAG: flagellar brake protein [Lachnospiraceae bacterium]|nr:flagellar brake protein [Lachnospiraceae bacterium]